MQRDPFTLDPFGTPATVTNFTDADIRGANLLPLPPTAFYVTRDTASPYTVTLHVQDGIQPKSRPLTVGYRFYFLEISAIGNVIPVGDSGRWSDLFNIATMVASIDSANKGGVIDVVAPAAYWEMDGYWWCAAVGRNGLEGNPSLPFRQPGITSSLPPDVTSPTKGSAHVTFGGQTYVQVTLSADNPNPLGTYVGFQVYMTGYRGEGLVEGIMFSTPRLVTSEKTSGSFLLLPDATATATTIYFVSVSDIGRRTGTPTASPSVTFSGGIV